MLNGHCSMLHTRTIIQDYYYTQNKEAQKSFYAGDGHRDRSQSIC